MKPDAEPTNNDATTTSETGRWADGWVDALENPTVPEASAGRKPSLIYTIAFDAPGKPFHQLMAKMLVSSIFRTGWSGDVLVITNSEHRVYENGRERLEEVSLDSTRVQGNLGLEAMKLKFGAGEFFDPSKYEWVMFVDCDCLFMQNPERLLNGNADILYATEPFTLMSDVYSNAYLTEAEIAAAKEAGKPGLNSGTLAVRASAYKEVMREWSRVYHLPRTHNVCHDQTSWARMVLDAGAKAEPFAEWVGIHYPLVETVDPGKMFQGTLYHFLGTKAVHKLAHIYGHYMRRFHPETMFSLTSLLDG